MDHEEDGESNGSVQKLHLSGDLWDYGSRDIMSGVNIQAAAATFIDKREDRHCISFGNEEMEECQIEMPDVPRMAAYLAVFDGHDGPKASEYCYRGLLSHILSETIDATKKQQSRHTKHDKNQIEAMDGSKVESLLDAAIINAFHRAQARFGNNLNPPTFDDVKKGTNATRYDNQRRLSRMYSKAKQRQKPRGGTTALTLMIYGESGRGSKTQLLDPMPNAIVVNTGDCRLLTDDGLGSHEYRQVTTDHRPEDADEHERLTQCVRQGQAVLGREVSSGTLRVYPGGLAVSRSLGDLTSSPAVICTPEIFRVPIAVCEGKTRLVLGSDGLYDVMTNQQIGEIVARIQKKEGEDNGEKETVVSPAQAASKLMEECLKNGGHLDDVTILVADVSYNGSSKE